MGVGFCDDLELMCDSVEYYDNDIFYIVYTNCILWTLSDNKVYLILSYLILH